MPVLSFQNIDLMPQGQVLEQEALTASASGHKRLEQGNEHVEHRLMSVDASCWESTLR